MNFLYFRAPRRDESPDIFEASYEEDYNRSVQLNI
jgi:hypothetical protein